MYASAKISLPLSAMAEECETSSLCEGRGGIKEGYAGRKKFALVEIDVAGPEHRREPWGSNRKSPRSPWRDMSSGIRMSYDPLRGNGGAGQPTVLCTLRLVQRPKQLRGKSAPHCMPLKV
jgi:hypothetical protein